MDGTQLRTARLAAGLSAREVAQAIGVTARSVERAESRAVRQATYQRQLRAVRTVLEERLAALDSLAAS